MPKTISRIDLPRMAFIGSWAMLFLLAGGSLWYLAQGNFFEASAGTASLLIYAWLQFGLGRPRARSILRLPAVMKIMISATALTSVFLGRFLAYYRQFSWFDKLQHLQFGLLFAIIGLALFYRYSPPDARSHNRGPGVTALFAVSFSQLCCFGWEVYEYACDRLFNTNMQAWKQGPVHGLIDTMNDLMFGLAGGLLVALAAFWLIRRDPEAFYKRHMAGFMPET